MAAIKVSDPGVLARDIRAVRDKHGFHKGEFKFWDTSRENIDVFEAAADAICASGASVNAIVIDRDSFDPFSQHKGWNYQSKVTTVLLKECVKDGRELVSVLLDNYDTPPGKYLDERVKVVVNSNLRSKTVISVLCVDSKSSDCVQMADLVAGSIRFRRRQDDLLKIGVSSKPDRYKQRLSRRMLDNFELENADDRQIGSLMIKTLFDPSVSRLTLVQNENFGQELNFPETGS